MNIKDVRESIDSDNTNLSYIGFAEKLFFNALNFRPYNFGPTRAKSAGPKSMEYLAKNVIEHP